MDKIPRSIDESPYREVVLAIQDAALGAVDPRTAVHTHMSREAEILRVFDVAMELSQFERVVVLGAGKAAQAMAQAVAEILGDRVDAGLVIAKYAGVDSECDTGPIQVVEAAHPVPDKAGVKAAEQLVKMADGAGERDLVLVLISGGASSLLTLPAEGITLGELQTTTDLLLASGASIQDINAVRKHLSRIKGGQLARRIWPARGVALILSDVVGDSLDTIGSGPTAPDSSTHGDALEVLQRFGLTRKVPAAVFRHLERGTAGQIEETPKPGDPAFAPMQNGIIGSNRRAARAAVEKARELGLNALLVTTSLIGESREVGANTSALLRDVVDRGQPISSPACLVLGGETTVTLRGAGKGGRNQELALSAALHMHGLGNSMILSLATDGGDGPTDAAGAVATPETALRARALGMEPFCLFGQQRRISFLRGARRLGGHRSHGDQRG